MKRLFLASLLLFFTVPSFAATCKISEYEYLIKDAAGREVPVASEPALVRQDVTYAASTASAAFASGTRFVRIVCDAKAHFVFATSPTAAATDPYLPADTIEYFGVIGGDKVAFYDGTS